MHSFLHHHVNINSFFSIEPRVLFNHTYTKPSCKMGALIFEQSNFIFSFICTPHKLEIYQQVSKYHVSVSFSFSFSFFYIKVFNCQHFSIKPSHIIDSNIPKIIQLKIPSFCHSTGIWIKYAYHRTSTNV